VVVDVGLLYDERHNNVDELLVDEKLTGRADHCLRVGE
jgi:hypothetical protein